MSNLRFFKEIKERGQKMTYEIKSKIEGVKSKVIHKQGRELFEMTIFLKDPIPIGSAPSEVSRLVFQLSPGEIPPIADEILPVLHSLNYGNA